MKMSVAEKTCRTCGKSFENNNEFGLCPLYNSTEYENEIKMALEEFEIWSLNITQNDGLPQNICLTCFDSFCQIHNFRLMCIEAQMNFGEMCTGLDIIINDEITDEDEDFLENNNGEKLVIVQEHYTFPGDKLLKSSTAEEELIEFASDDIVQELEELTEIEQDLDDRGNKPEEYNLDLKQYRCEFCMGFVSFDDPDELNRHYNELHSSILPYPCPKCDLHFDKKGKRNSHVRTHFDVKPLECNHCGKKIRGDQQMMTEHKAYYHVNKNRECPICQLKFENISLNNYYYHMIWHNDSKLLKCKFCDKKFIQSQHLQTHERTHTGETDFVCTECGLGCKNSILLHKHILLHERKELVECPKCPKRYFTRTGIKLHNKKTHNPDKKPLCCEICDKKFPYTHDLLTHNHKKHGGPAPKRTKRSAQPLTSASTALKIIKKQKRRDLIKPHKCDKCEEAFVLEVQLLRHSKIHDEYRPHPCKLCSKSFKREAHLKLHMDNIHFNNKPHKCSICGSAFIQKSHLHDHIDIKHNHIRNHQCKVCQKKFGTSQILKIHMATHSDERPFICKICHKGFKQLIVLKSHMTVHLSKKGGKYAEKQEGEQNEIKEEFLIY